MHDKSFSFPHTARFISCCSVIASNTTMIVVGMRKRWTYSFTDTATATVGQIGEGFPLYFLFSRVIGVPFQWINAEVNKTGTRELIAVKAVSVYYLCSRLQKSICRACAHDALQM